MKETEQRIYIYISLSHVITSNYMNFLNAAAALDKSLLPNFPLANGRESYFLRVLLNRHYLGFPTELVLHAGSRKPVRKRSTPRKDNSVSPILAKGKTRIVGERTSSPDCAKTFARIL